MTDPIRHELTEDLRAATLGEGVACDYHQRPKELSTDVPVLFEAIRLVDHPQLDEYPDHWLVDAARCSDHAVDEIVEPTRGVEEALIRAPVSVSNGVVSVSPPAPESVYVHDFAPATEGLPPMVIDQHLMDASEPEDMGYFRWTRVLGLLAAEPPDPLREHIEERIDWSPEPPAGW